MHYGKGLNILLPQSEISLYHVCRGTRD